MAKKAPSKAGGGKGEALTGLERVVVLCGDETYLHEAKLREIKEAAERVSGDEPVVIRFEGKTARLADVLDEVRGYSLMGGRKVVVVDQADPFIKQHRESLEKYADEAVDFATLVLRAGTWNATWRLHKATQRVGAVVKCERLAAPDAAKWAAGFAEEKYGVKMEGRAAGILVEHLGTSMGLLATEVGKLAASTPEGQAITVDRVERLVGAASEEKAWEIQAPLLKGDAGESVAKVRELVTLADVPVQVVGYFVADLMRKLCRAAVMAGQGVGDFEVCKELKIWGDRTRPFMAAATRLGVARSGRMLEEYVRMDSRSKSGYGGFAQGLERFCVELAGAVGR